MVKGTFLVRSKKHGTEYVAWEAARDNIAFAAPGASVPYLSAPSAEFWKYYERVEPEAQADPPPSPPEQPSQASLFG